MDETMETVQGDIESAWSAEDPAGEAEGTESAAAADQPKGGEETPPAEPKCAGSAAGAVYPQEPGRDPPGDP